MKTVGIVQARMGSTRLPAKVMQSILGKPMLWWVVHRVGQCRLIDDVIIATTTEPTDDTIVTLCEQEGWPFYRGSENDVLDRYYQAARQVSAAHIVRITSDCPLIDPAVTDYVIAAYRTLAPAVDYVSNTLTRTYPRGLDTEVFSFAALERAWTEDSSVRTREHVTPFLYQNPDRFRLYNVVNPVDFSHYRLTVDTPQDLQLVRHLYEHFGHGDFSWRDILAVLDEYPEWLDLNRDVQQKAL